MLIRASLNRLDGINDLRFNLIGHRLTVDHTTSRDHILQALKQIGLPGYVEGSFDPPHQRNTTVDLWIVATAILLLFAGLGLEQRAEQSLYRFGFYALSIVFASIRVLPKTLSAIRNRVLDVNILMMVASIGTIILGQFPEAAAVLSFYALSLVLEIRSLERSRRSIQALLNLSPQKTMLKVDGSFVERISASIQRGDILLLREGERIPVDGEVLLGISTVDESHITGESDLKAKCSGDVVYAGSLNARGWLEVRAISTATDSSLRRIVHLVEEAQSKKIKIQTLTERFARAYVPAVFAIAVAVFFIPTFFFHANVPEWFYRSLTVLVISCPCALLIATPVTILSSLTRASKEGVLFKGGSNLEALATVRSMAFDKTGTVANARTVLTEIIPLDGIDQNGLLRIASAIELRSHHPIASAFLEFGFGRNLSVEDATVNSIETISGKGIRASVDGLMYFLGNHELMESKHLCSPSHHDHFLRGSKQSMTVLALANSERILGFFSIHASQSVSSRNLVPSLHALGIHSVDLLSGDQTGAVEAIQSEFHFDSALARQLPQNKINHVKQLKAEFGSVAMVGDGLNDAPALAEATIGIAIGPGGSAVAIEVADIVLMDGGVQKIPFAIQLSRSTLSILRFNIGLTIATKLAFLVLGVLGISSLWLAIIADDGITLLVILNSLRLLRFSVAQRRILTNSFSLTRLRFLGRLRLKLSTK